SADRLLLYLPRSASSWFSCRMRVAATGSSAGVSTRLLVEICCCVLLTAFCTSSIGFRLRANSCVVDILRLIVVSPDLIASLYASGPTVSTGFRKDHGPA